MKINQESNILSNFPYATEAIREKNKYMTFFIITTETENP